MKKYLFVLFLVLSHICLAADDPRLRIYPQQGIMTFKGLDEKSSPTAVQDGRAIEAQNVQFSLTGGVSKRNGYNRVNAVLNEYLTPEYFPAITGLYYTKLSNATAYRMVTVGRRVYYDNAGTWTDITGGFVSTYAANNQFVWTTALDNIVFSNDVNVVRKWTGTGTISNLGFTGLTNSPTKVKCLAWFRNYLILGNTVENSIEYPTRIRWSNVGTIGTWTNADYIDIDALGGQEINGFGILGDNLYVLLTDSVYKVSLVGGDETFVVSKVIEGTGCIAKNSVQNISLSDSQEGLIFLSKDKTVTFFDGRQVINASLLIDDTMDGLNTSRLDYAVSASDGSDYYLSVSNGTSSTNNLVLDLNTDTGDWSRHTNILSNAMARVLDSDGNVQIYSGNYDSIVYKLFDTSLDSDIIGKSDGVSSVETYNLPNGTATGLSMLVMDTTVNYASTGAVVTVTSGTGSGQDRIIVFGTSTGLVVDSAFTTVPDSGSVVSLGAINAIYTTKWFDFGEPSRLKQFGELYLWAKEEGSMDMEVNYAKDFGGYAGSQSISLQGSGGLWGTAVWGTSNWGGQEALLKRVKLKGQGRFTKFKFSNDDIDETFNLYGFNTIYWAGDIQ